MVELNFQMNGSLDNIHLRGCSISQVWEQLLWRMVGVKGRGVASHHEMLLLGWRLLLAATVDRVGLHHCECSLITTIKHVLLMMCWYESSGVLKQGVVSWVALLLVSCNVASLVAHRIVQLCFCCSFCCLWLYIYSLYSWLHSFICFWIKRW